MAKKQQTVYERYAAEEPARRRMIGARIREARLRARMTQIDVASAAGLNQQRVSEAENVGVSIGPVLYAIADVLGENPLALAASEQ